MAGNISGNVFARRSLSSPRTASASRGLLKTVRLRTAFAKPSAFSTSIADTSIYEKLQGLKVVRSSDGARVELVSLWAPTEQAVVAFARSLGELAIQLRRDVKPALDAKGVKLFLVSIGTWERSKDFVKVTGFPAESLLVDPETVTYDALGLKKGVKETFLSWETPQAIKKRMDSNATADLQEVMKNWQPWQPPRPDQALNQGGLFVFDGPRCVYRHFDAATSDHADLGQVRELAVKLAGDCGCA